MQHYPHYAETMPAQLRAMIKDIAEASKDAPWYAAFDHMRGLWQMAEAVFPDEHDEAKQMHGCLVAAVLELMGADPRRVTDSIESALHAHASCKDYADEGQGRVPTKKGVTVPLAKLPWNYWRDVCNVPSVPVCA